MLHAALVATAVTAALHPAGPHVVDLHGGIIKGFGDASNNSVFLGIPFAETTGGENR